MHFFVNVLRGDFGTSMMSKRPVSEEIASRFMPTFWMTITSMMLATSGISFPAFALGMLLMQVFSVNLGWLPTVGADSWRHYILPFITLGAAVAAVMARFTRPSLVEVLQEDYIRTASAKGVPESLVVVKNGLRKAMIPLVTMMGL